ncbi:Oidioi.mRNA.OKI2018_I69.chr2.g5687.t1.cds [Oikopleura dioica]|uniref:Oidioi.mRNA.OKI2018_I69.chr2.g5687.t1.cds n=1 Tax=Oikopleura dioica TaxID=34765 RepID=A0ABN7T179_OIKDI|nr:Oidioi.mRNA.OKI2018_I69.chr2.g5687.t1.cds [Oikopleura dioica]
MMGTENRLADLCAAAELMQYRELMQEEQKKTIAAQTQLQEASLAALEQHVQSPYAALAAGHQHYLPRTNIVYVPVPIGTAEAARYASVFIPQYLPGAPSLGLSPYASALGVAPPVPPNKLTLAPMSSPVPSLSSPGSALGSSLGSAVSTPTEERAIILPKEEICVSTPPKQSPQPIAVPTQLIAQDSSRIVPKQITLVKMRPKKVPDQESPSAKVEGHFRRSLGSPIVASPVATPRRTEKKRPHTVYVDQNVAASLDSHFEKSLGAQAWRECLAKRAKLAPPRQQNN